MFKRLITFTFGVGIGVGFGAALTHKIDKAAQAAAQAASPSFIAKKVGAGAANMVNRAGEGWREARADSDGDVTDPPQDEFTARSVRKLRAG